MRVLPVLFFSSISCLLLAQSVPSSQGAYSPLFSSDKNRAEVGPVNAAADAVNGYVFKRVYCDPLPSSAMRAAVEAEGAVFLGYLGRNTYVMALPIDYEVARLQRINARRLWAVTPEEKLHRNLLEEPYGDWAVEGDRVHLYVQVYPQVRIQEAGDRFRALGYDVVEEGSQSGFLHVRVPRSAVYSVAALPFVRYVELMPPPSVPEDLNGRALHRSGLLDTDSPLGRRYDGSGVIAVVRDDGPIGPHIDFKGRYTGWGDVETINDGDHGDGVAGILGGAGNLNPHMRGMAAGVHLYAIPYRANFQDATVELVDLGATLTNTSYSNGCNTGYTLTARIVEEQLYNNPALMHVFSAGNEGTSNCNYGAGPGWGNITGGHKVAKNAMAVANLRADGTLMGSSSRGPVHDGRLKPDLAAHGHQQGSTAPNHTYQAFGGTSAAAPGVVGVLAQLTQAYREHYSGAQPPAALLKAALLNTANDLGNPGPDFQFGWGMVNAWRAYRLLTEGRWLRSSADHQATGIHSLTVPPGVRQLRVFLYWADPPAEAGAQRALINDLDLEVVAPDGTVLLPLVLNPKPDPAALSAPAKPGRDSLNNAEQVVAVHPAPGAYTLRVKGYEVPLGPAEYYLVWDFLYDSLKIVYPVGGEGVAPGETCRIHWDALDTTGSFLLQYSLDNGQTWEPIAIVEGSARMYDWNVPNAVSGQVRVRVSRGGFEDVSESPFSIVGVPTDLKVERVCLDSATLSWKPIHDTLHYDVYVLGEKYMEIVGSGAGARQTVPISHPGQEQWFSVRAAAPSGLAGRRALAIQWSGGLKECPQPRDLALKELLSPQRTAIESAVACQPITWPVRVRVANEGTLPAQGGLIHYQLNDDPPVADTLPDLSPGESTDFAFDAPLMLVQSGQNRLRMWTTLAGENVFFNDTLTLFFRSAIGGRDTPFVEGFSDAVFPPPGWAVANPDSATTWRRYSLPVVGPDGLPTLAAYLNFFDYSTPNEEDYLYLPPLDLGRMPRVNLVFHWAYALYSEEYFDGLRVELFPNCDLSAEPIVLWGKAGSNLATRSPSSSFFTPSGADEWRAASIPLDSFAPQHVIIRLAAVNGYGNNLFIDNLGVALPDTTLPLASISASADTVCRAIDTAQFWVGSPLPGTFYIWSFGTGAQPATASGPGPHAVRFLTAGGHTVRLIASNANGADTASYPVYALGTATSAFSWAADMLTVTFENKSLNAEEYAWDFGDGNTSLAANPVHTYAASGDYTVALRTRNRCSALWVASTQTVLVRSVRVQEPTEILYARALPNPNSGVFALHVTAAHTVSAEVALFDAQGQRVVHRNEDLVAGEQMLFFEVLPLPAGVYWLHLHTPSGALVRRIVVVP